MDHSLADAGRMGLFTRLIPPFFAAAGGLTWHGRLAHVFKVTGKMPVLLLENGDWEASRC
jgi:hypothetical protein